MLGQLGINRELADIGGAQDATGKIGAVTRGILRFRQFFEFQGRLLAFGQVLVFGIADPKIVPMAPKVVGVLLNAALVQMWEEVTHRVLRADPGVKPSFESS